jgi:hypothetical protein
MTSEAPPMLNNSEHPDQHDLSDLISEFRRRQLDIFRQRELKTELEGHIRTAKKMPDTTV